MLDVLVAVLATGVFTSIWASVWLADRVHARTYEIDRVRRERERVTIPATVWSQSLPTSRDQQRTVLIDRSGPEWIALEKGITNGR